jgi:flagellar motility protein MotE (MotC chaperone)
MNMKRIIIMAAAGLLSFSGAFLAAKFTKSADVTASEPNQSAAVAMEAGDSKTAQATAETQDTAGLTDSDMRKTITEKQLKSLVYEVREKMREYNTKLQDIEQREQRLQITQDTIKKDVEELTNLRTELATTVASVKEQRDRLLKTRLEIAQTEKANLATISATYDKMDAASAGKILTSMCATQTQSGADATGSADDAVKILYYMSEGKKAKVLAELVTSEPKLAAFLCQRLKQTMEK